MTLFSKDGNTDTDKLFKDRKVLVVGIPGAFTPVCQTNHVRGGCSGGVRGLSDSGVDSWLRCQCRQAARARR
jgi:peroxiredoxin